jgi:hypothetical protein
MKKGIHKMFTFTTDINFNTPKELIEQFALEHCCELSEFTLNGPAGGNHLCTFTSESQDCLEELIGQLKQ